MNPGIIALSIPIVAIVTFTTMVVFIRNYMHRERMAMIERGLQPSEFKTDFSFGKRDPHRSLRTALTAIGVGIGLFWGNYLRSFDAFDRGGTVAGMICICGGLGLLTAYFIQYGFKRVPQKIDDMD